MRQEHVKDPAKDQEKSGGGGGGGGGGGELVTNRGRPSSAHCVDCSCFV